MLEWKERKIVNFPLTKEDFQEKFSVCSFFLFLGFL